MPIPVSLIIDQCNALLDAEDSDRYTFDEDYKLAINNTQRWFISLLDRVFGSTKISEESLSELHKLAVFKASNYSRITFEKDVVGEYFPFGPLCNAYPVITESHTLRNAAVVNIGGGKVMMAVDAPPGCGYMAGERVIIHGTINYDGVHTLAEVIRSAGGGAIIIYAPYIAETPAATDTIKRIRYIWSITGVYPEPTLIGTLAGANGDFSIFQDRVSVSNFGKAATRLTIEEWAEKEKNPLIPGSSLISNTELKEYAYMGPIDFLGSRAYTTESLGEKSEIEISPSIANQAVAITYLMYPDEILLETDLIMFPERLINIIVNKVVNFISIKEDDRVNLYEITERELGEVVDLLS